MRSSQKRWSWPYWSSGASGLPSAFGVGPFSVAVPLGRVRDVTAASRPSAESAATSPGRGPKPARQSRRSASRVPNVPW